MNDTPPEIDNAPGHVWKPRKAGWECRWQARTDLVRRGYLPKSARIWTGVELTELDKDFIRTRCQAMQDEMLTWGHGGQQVLSAFNGTVRSLINCYELDADSSYHKLRYKTKETYNSLMRRIFNDMADMNLADLKARDVKRFHEQWASNGRVAMGHSLVGMLRTLVSFGATILESEECERLAIVLHRMRFSMASPRTERLTAEHVIAIRAKAHEMGLHSIALAQAIQFEAILRQKDVIGEWVPISEPGVSDVLSGNSKWVRGIRWEEITRPDLVLHHVTSKRGKLVEPTLGESPMVIEEFALLGELPTKGPIIVSDLNALPWAAHEFRRQWRKVANAAGVPKEVYNMDSRAGAISEATDAGADLEHVRHAATHSNISMTQRYSRNGSEKTAGVMRTRAAHRNKAGTNE